jgi:hypothetical protein
MGRQDKEVVAEEPIVKTISEPLKTGGDEKGGNTRSKTAPRKRG